MPKVTRPAARLRRSCSRRKTGHVSASTPVDLFAADLSLTPAAPVLILATKLGSRGGRSERDCGISQALGHPVEEYVPRGQAFADSRTREVLRLLDLEVDAAPFRPVTPMARNSVVDPKPRPSRKVHPRAKACDVADQFVFGVLEREPDISAKEFFQQFDQAIYRERNQNRLRAWEPRERWIKATGKRTWAELHRHRLTKKSLQTWFDRRRAKWRATQVLR
jgi:hypothetical protein